MHLIFRCLFGRSRPQSLSFCCDATHCMAKFMIFYISFIQSITTEGSKGFRDAINESVDDIKTTEI